MIKNFLTKKIYTRRSKDLFYMRFSNQLSVLLSSGITIEEALKLLENQFTGGFQEEILALYQGIEQGKMFSAVIEERKFYPKMFCGLVKAGESTGKMNFILEKASKHFEHQFETREKLKNALAYPIVLMLVLPIVIAFLLNFVLPTFISLFDQEKELLPFSTQILLYFSQWISNKGKYIILIGGLLYIVYRFFSMKGNAKYKRDKRSLNSIFGKIRIDYYMFQLSSNLSVLLNSGVPILESLNIVKEMMTNEYYYRMLKKTIHEIKHGKDLHMVWDEFRYIPKTLVALVRVGEVSGELPKLLDGAHHYYEGEFKRKLERITKMIEPIMILILAGVVGFVVLSIALPMFDLINLISD